MKTGEKRVQLIDVDCCETKLNCGFKWIYFDDDEISWKQILIEGNLRLRKQTRQYKSLEYDPTRHNKNNNNTTSNDENISKMKNPKIFFCWFFCWINFSFVFFSLFFFRFFYKYIWNLFFSFSFQAYFLENIQQFSFFYFFLEENSSMNDVILLLSSFKMCLWKSRPSRMPPSHMSLINF